MGGIAIIPSPSWWTSQSRPDECKSECNLPDGASSAGAWLLRMLVVDKKLRLYPSRPTCQRYCSSVRARLLAGQLPALVPLATAKPRCRAMGATAVRVSIGAFLRRNTLQSLRLIKIFTWTFIGFGRSTCSP